MKNLLFFFLISSLIFTNLPAASGQAIDMALFKTMKPRNIGPAGMSGRVNTIDVVLSDPDVIYIGAAAGGVWKSENSGHTWTPIFENESTSAIGDLKIYQKNPNIIYVGTGEGNPRNSLNSGRGMWKTMDGGSTWQHIGLENTRQIHRVIVHPDNPDIVYAGVLGSPWGAHQQRGVYKTTDGGKTWKNLLYINDRTGTGDLVMDPSNPNKLIVGMWHHQRDAWFFKSGGEGSGMHITYDGGETWKQLTHENGLPKGELGRIGLSFAPSNPEYVYAYIESKETAVYQSKDGGHNWKKVSQKGEDIGGRPFYYADIFVDTKNENRLYSIATEVTVSDDGGRTWSTFAPGNKVHTDHHAWWSHPDDPEYVMMGNDGGIHITHDRGEKFWFVENLPLAQFYHMRVDNEIPYNVYGGLQDNGSWVGPSQTWFKGGIRNMYWQRLSVGDGFDVVPDPMDSNFGYAMGQAGNLVRYDRKSGQLQRIKPIHPNGENLRFNWNAGIGINPIDKKTVYYGSQYLHKSADYGQSWQIISPDLTTNNPEKQKILETGGLSYDVTGAENHTTIITVAPSPLDENVIWVGTDDGNVQLTTDGGDTWKKINEGMRGVPANTWVPHIEPSHFNAREAYVVFEDHRRNNWEPYVYHTSDNGVTWTRIADRTDVETYVNCITEDPIEPNLLFCGTDIGFYVSFNKGGQWHKWTNGMPTTPVTDMIIHPREHDLVIGTFGRSFWILDDIRPLRAMAKQSNVLNNSLAAFESPNAILANIGESIGYRDGKVGDVLYQGENRPYGALLSFYLKETDSDQDTVQIEIRNSKGQLVRNLEHISSAGVNRLTWNLSRNGVRRPTQPKPSKTRFYSGKSVLPGDYIVKFIWKDQTAETNVKIVPDPRINVSWADMEKKDRLISRHDEIAKEVTDIMDEVRETQEGLKFVKSKSKELRNEEFSAFVEAFEKELSKISEQVSPKPRQGIFRDPNTLIATLSQTNYLLDDVLSPGGENLENQLKSEAIKAASFKTGWKAFKEKYVKEMKTQITDLGIGLF